MNIFLKLYLFLRDCLTSPLVINAYVFYQGNCVKQTNWGDDINYFFLKEISRKRICIHQHSSYSYFFKKTNYLVIGSTVNLLCNEQSVVWGAGVISDDLELPYKPIRVYAVRGPLTRKYLLKRGIACPEVYGDPALLLSLYYRPKIEKKHRMGIVLHYKDQTDENKKRILEAFPDVCFIDIAHYDHWLGFVDKLLSCNVILSSSLHGLIMAESYGIPNVWVKLSDNVMGGEFKFHDFFLSINRDRLAPVDLTSHVDANEVGKAIHSWNKGSIDLRCLINSCPFKIKYPDEYIMDV